MDFPKRKAKGDKMQYSVITLDLFKPGRTKYPEFDYEEIRRDHLGEGDSSGEDERFHDKEALTLVRRLEAKYGNKKTKQGKRVRFGGEDDYIDKSAGYDLDDDFIDDTEAYDEMIPSSMDTKKGGFYVNKGALDFKWRREELDDSDISDSEQPPESVTKQSKKRKADAVCNDKSIDISDSAVMLPSTSHDGQQITSNSTDSTRLVGAPPRKRFIGTNISSLNQVAAKTIRKKQKLTKLTKVDLVPCPPDTLTVLDVSANECLRVESVPNESIAKNILGKKISTDISKAIVSRFSDGQHKENCQTSDRAQSENITITNKGLLANTISVIDSVGTDMLMNAQVSQNISKTSEPVKLNTLTSASKAISTPLHGVTIASDPAQSANPSHITDTGPADDFSTEEVHNNITVSALQPSENTAIASKISFRNPFSVNQSASTVITKKKQQLATLKNKTKMNEAEKSNGKASASKGVLNPTNGSRPTSVSTQSKYHARISGIIPADASSANNKETLKPVNLPTVTPSEPKGLPSADVPSEHVAAVKESCTVSVNQSTATVLPKKTQKLAVPRNKTKISATEESITKASTSKCVLTVSQEPRATAESGLSENTVNVTGNIAADSSSTAQLGPVGLSNFTAPKLEEVKQAVSMIRENVTPDFFDMLKTCDLATFREKVKCLLMNNVVSLPVEKAETSRNLIKNKPVPIPLGHSELGEGMSKAQGVPAASQGSVDEALPLAPTSSKMGCLNNSTSVSTKPKVKFTLGQYMENEKDERVPVFARIPIDDATVAFKTELSSLQNGIKSLVDNSRKAFESKVEQSLKLGKTAPTKAIFLFTETFHTAVKSFMALLWQVLSSRRSPSIPINDAMTAAQVLQLEVLPYFDELIGLGRLCLEICRRNPDNYMILRVPKVKEALQLERINPVSASIVGQCRSRIATSLNDVANTAGDDEEVQIVQEKRAKK